MQAIAKKIHRLLEGEADTTGALSLRVSIQLLILLNVAAVVLGTVEPIGTRWATELRLFELASISIFTIEYIARIATCNQAPEYAGPIRGRLRYAATPLALVDLLAIAPAYVPLLLGVDLRAMRALRLIRIFRILKLGRYSKAVQSLGRALTDRGAELATLAFALLIVLTLASSLLFLAEHEAQPEAFSSIPAAAWWGVATLTTVGYGDVAPVTPLGKALASVVAILGIGLFALPAGVFGSAFVDQLRQEAERCPHCGGVL